MLRPLRDHLYVLRALLLASTGVVLLGCCGAFQYKAPLAAGTGVTADVARVDELAGVAVGAPLYRVGYTCYGSLCQRPAIVAGIDGRLDVHLCGDVVGNVAFNVIFLDMREVPSAGWSLSWPAGMHASMDAAFEAREAVRKLVTASESAGWHIDAGELHGMDVGGMQVVSMILRKDDKVRSLISASSSDVILGIRSETHHVTLTSHSLQCQSGI